MSPIHGGGGGSNNGGNMDVRLSKLETRLDTVLPTLATKSDIHGLNSDIHREFTAQTRWTFTTVLAIVAVAVAVLVFAINRIAPPPSQPTPQQPTVIVVPSGQVPSIPPPPKGQ